MSSVLPFAPLTRHDVAAVMQKSVRTLGNWCTDGSMPAPVSLGGGYYWHPNVFYAWLDAVLRGEPWDDESLLSRSGPITPIRPITIEEAVKVMGRSVRRLEQWYDEGIMPRPVKIGGSRYWHPALFYEWLDLRLKGHSTENLVSKAVVESHESPPLQQQAPADAQGAGQPSRRARGGGSGGASQDRHGLTTGRARSAALLQWLNSA